ncbi:hypothetical protein KY092_20680 [Natronomonas gomsonensis]|uniref:hypothetical protein n=1 Tax=Natronomonas gomsonensis TaxID=1046043 RepID=UPI00227A6F3B|nr:hypothetical protein [Natronomonas gomsonensis]MCY4732949.1 hypothetical protein [Natronomonas gomsonensis]
MQRRNLLIGMGSLAAGGAATIGTGAFTSVDASRTAQINIAGDSSALLALDDSNSTNADYVEYSTYDEAFINIESDNSELNESPSGINTDADTKIDDIFRVRNQGTQEAFVYVDPDSVTPNTITYSGDDGTMYFDANMTDAPNGRRDSGSLTAIYDLPARDSGSAGPSFPDVDGISDMVGRGSPGYNGWEWVLRPGESFEFGLTLNVPQGDDGDYDISLDLVADAEIAAEWRASQ